MNEETNEALRLAEEYRPTMPPEVLHLWAKDVVAKLRRLHALRAAAPAVASIEDLCARIKAADDAAADRDYMLDSNDCIAVLRGTWKGASAADMPLQPSAPQAQQPTAPQAGAESYPPSDRDAFEAWAKEQGYQRDELARSTLGLVGPEYFNLNTEMAWKSWQASATAALRARGAVPQGQQPGASKDPA